MCEGDAAHRENDEKDAQSRERRQRSERHVATAAHQAGRDDVTDQGGPGESTEERVAARKDTERRRKRRSGESEPGGLPRKRDTEHRQRDGRSLPAAEKRRQRRHRVPTS